MKVMRFPPAFVNRERELEIMKSAMERAREGKGSTILITGDVGVGKTRLAEEFAEICESQGFVVLSSLCLGSNEPAYFPVLTALENYAKKARAEKEAYVPLGLAGFQHLEVEEKTPNGLAKERTRMLEYLLKQFVEIGAKQPVLFVVDDLHFADSATLAFFHYLSRNVRKERILVVATYVEEYANASTIFAKTLRNMSIERIYTTLRLGNFGERETEIVVAQLGFENPSAVGKSIYERTSGNPFFVVEFLTALMAENVKGIEEIKKRGLPESVMSLIRLRIAKLSEKAMKTLTAAAVLGRAFEYQAIKRLVDLTEEELLEALDELRAQNILIECKDFEEGYRFTSNTVHEVVYADLSGMRKKLLHQKAGKVLEEMHSNEEKFWCAIATHYRNAAVREKFIEYGIKAGRAAARRFANAEAIEFLEGVVEVLGNTQKEAKRKAEVLADLAEVLELEGRFDEALAMLERRIGLLHGDVVEIGKTRRKRAEVYISKGDFEKALAESENAEKQLSVGDAELELARAWSTKALVFERTGAYRKAIENQEKALAVFEKENAEKDMANAIHRIGCCYGCLGEYEKELELYHKALLIRKRINDLRGVANTYNNIGSVYYYKGEAEKALEFFTRALELMEKIGDVRGIGVIYNNIGVIYHEMGEYEKALEFHEKSLEIKKKIGDVWGIGASYNNIGVIYNDRGEYDKALEFQKRSLEILEKIGDLHGVGGCYNNIGIVYYEMEEYEKAMDSFTRSVEVIKKIGDKSTLGWSLLGLCECLLRSNDLEECRRHLEEAKRIVEEVEEKPLHAYFFLVLGKLLNAELRTAEAEEAIERAKAISEEIGRLGVDYHKTLFELGRLRKDKALLEKALAFFEKIGNKVWAERAREEIKMLE